MATVAVTHFSDRLADAVERKRSQLVVGLDPVVERLAGRGRTATSSRFCCGIVDAVRRHAVAVKPQSAFFEALGSDGVRAFEQVCAYARAAGLLVIADVKRGDIGSTAARGVRRARSSRSPTRSPSTRISARDSLEPFVDACRREGAGLFCLVKTSNPGGADVQDVRARGRTPALAARRGARRASSGETLVGERGLSSVGAVVGATFPREVAEARQAAAAVARSCCPGSARRAAAPADVAAAFAAGPASALVSASRSVIYAYRDGGGDWRDAAGAEAERLAREVWSVSGA